MNIGRKPARETMAVPPKNNDMNLMKQNTMNMLNEVNVGNSVADTQI